MAKNAPPTLEDLQARRAALAAEVARLEQAARDAEAQAGELLAAWCEWREVTREVLS